jgi:hypothetical protein
MVRGLLIFENPSIAIVWLTKLFNLIFQSNKMPDEWRQIILVRIFKGKVMCKVVLIIRGPN